MTQADFLAGLQPRCRAFFTKLFAEFPFLEPTCGKRDWDAQAFAMATNCAQAPTGFGWLIATYKDKVDITKVYRACLDSGLHVSDTAGIATIILGALAQLTPEQLGHISIHESGQAGDLKPLTDDRAPSVRSRIGELVAEEIAAGGSAWFTDNEGGLSRWHAQVREIDTDTTPVPA